MNDFEGYAQRRRRGWCAMVRFASDGKAEPVLGSRGEPVLYDDELTATKAALAHILAYFNGHLVRSGEIAGSSIALVRRASAERLFRKGGKVVEVRRVRSAADRD